MLYFARHRHLPGANLLGCLTLACTLAYPGHTIGQEDSPQVTLEQLTEERQQVTEELEQYRKTLALLQAGDTPPEESSNPAVRSLAIESAALKERLIVITEQEVTLLQQQITASRSDEAARVAAAREKSNSTTPQNNAMESKPLRTHSAQHTSEQEVENVNRLHGLLQNYYTELQESASILPTAEEMKARETAQRDAATLEKIPYSPGKVRLTGAEGSASLAEISKRLMDNRIPESRRDIAPICLIKTRLFGTLIVSENRSLKPVGKNHYIARVRIQPGNTTLAILADEWELRLPQHANAQDYLITLYRPVEGEPELHVFAVDDLLALKDGHIPAWLPKELDISQPTG